VNESEQNVGENREEMNTHDEVGETICYDQVDRAYCQDVDETVWGIVVKRDAAGWKNRKPMRSVAWAIASVE
jgi:hypothetical protein